MSATLRAAVFGAFLSFAGAAVAAGDAGLPSVTVTAPRPPTTQELAGDAVPNFVRSHSTPSRVIGQLTRWRTPVCPWAKGLGDAMDNFVSARIRAVAAAVGAPHDESPKCKPNVRILFVLDPEKQVESLLKSESASLGFHYPAETKSFTAFTHPVQGWYVTSTRNWRGLETVDDPHALSALDPAVGFEGIGTPPPGDPSSRLDNYISSQVVLATIIADRNKITGMTIGSLSDYIAVLTLTQARLSEGCSQLPSIMDLMAPGCPGDKRPDQVTAGDLAYLRALYSADLETPVQIERSNIEAAMLRAFADRR
jgi:hypothetical protein